ncbi:MAG: hypothetical protein U9N49_12670 [Campylobacterota bacterium]|nr:hypothetical protein [Campylobacterota bacterium]
MQTKIWKSHLRAIFWVVILSNALFASVTRSDVKLLEASEDIKLISQQIAKEYFYFSKFPHKKDSQKKLYQTLSFLDERLRLIASTTKSEDTKDLLSFLSLSREEIESTLTKKYSQENSTLMLDYSDILLEGAISIANDHRYNFSQEEKMLIRIKHFSFLIERMSKYYFAYQSGFRDQNTIKRLHATIKDFETVLNQINSYRYGGEVAKNLESINAYWAVVKKFYLEFNKRDVPNIVYISTDYLKTVITSLELYHSKNL